MAELDAYCPLYWLATGGQIDPKTSRPVGWVEGVEGKCPQPVNCGECNLMQHWLRTCLQEGWDPTWECLECVKRTKAYPRELKGFFQEGICTLCHYETFLLQLVLRKRKESEMIYNQQPTPWAIEHGE